MSNYQEYTDEQLIEAIKWHYRDYPMVMELVNRFDTVERKLWVARLGAACQVKDGY